VRERKRIGDLQLICQMFSGCSTTSAAYLGDQLRDQLADWEDGTRFLIWFMNWQQEYLEEISRTFRDVRANKWFQNTGRGSMRYH